MEFVSHSTEDTENIAAQFVRGVVEKKGAGVKACTVGLVGELGAGKTTFVKAVAKAFGLSRTVTSPTFVIEKIYKLENQPFDHLIHVDAYRLERGEELRHLGWDDISKDPKNIIFIEWPEKVKDILPDDIIKISFEVAGEEERKIMIKNLESGI